MGRQRPGDLLLAERLEVAGGGDMAGSAVAHRERGVRHLADEGLDEGELAPLRRARIDELAQELGLGQRSKTTRQLLDVDPGNGREPRRREALPEDRRILDE